MRILVHGITDIGTFGLIEDQLRLSNQQTVDQRPHGD